MIKKKKIKLYTHHFSYHEFLTHTERVFKLKKVLFRFARKALRLAFQTCYYAGFAVVQVSYLTGLCLIYACLFLFKDPRSRLKREMSATILVLRKKSMFLKERRVQVGMAVFFLLLAGQISLFKSATLVALGLEVKGKVLGNATVGLGYLDDAQKSLQSQNIELAQQEFDQAIKNFYNSQLELEQAGTLLNGVLSILPQKRSADNILEAAKLSGEAGKELTQFYQALHEMKITAQGLQAKTQISKIFQRMRDSLTRGVAKVDLITKLIYQLDETNVPTEQRYAFSQAKAKLQNLQQVLRASNDLFDMLDMFLLGKKRVLVFFQNNNELRPSGGFLGTYGTFELLDGRIGGLTISSIYDLDGQLNETIPAPYPLRRVSPAWHLRDSNWFGDFPASAKKMSVFYEKEGGDTPDVVLVLTPNVITDLLKITGPISMPKYQVTLDADNFVEATQVITSVTYDKNLNQPKQMLADFFPTFLQKLSDLDLEGSARVLQAIQQNLGAKHILFYSRIEQLQRAFSQFNWAGEIKNSDRDYLLVSTANLNGSKTDLGISQDSALESEITESGLVTNTLTITRKNNMPVSKAFNNISFMRIYLPEDSRLVSATGFSPEVFSPAEEPVIKNASIDPDAYEWERNSVKDLLSGTLIGNESGKTFFGNWVETPGGQTQTVRVKYTLPFILKNLDRYSLLLQKQPGAVNQTFSYTLKFSGRALDWKNFTPKTLDVNSLQISEPLERDHFYGLVLHKRGE